jgi:hypothetical protein
MPEPDVLNYAWREYALRVGAWRCMELFDELALPTAAIINTANSTIIAPISRLACIREPGGRSGPFRIRRRSTTFQ